MHSRRFFSPVQPSHSPPYTVHGTYISRWCLLARLSFFRITRRYPCMQLRSTADGATIFSNGGLSLSDEAVLAANGVNYGLFRLFDGNDEPKGFFAFFALPRSPRTTAVRRQGFFPTTRTTPGNQTRKTDLKINVYSCVAFSREL